MSEAPLQVRGDALSAARAAARFVTECARRAVAERGKCVVAFSGGSTPRDMLGALAGEDLPWRQLHVFQVDERVAPEGDSERNLTQLQEALLGNTPLTADALHPMPVDAADLESAAHHYGLEAATATDSSMVLDLVHLGLGDDGHTASLVPGDSALEVMDRDVAISGDYRGYRRMTLTLPMLNRARQRLWLVTGAGKSDMLARLRASDHGIPAGRVGAQDTIVFADSAAAKLRETQC